MTRRDSEKHGLCQAVAPKIILPRPPADKELGVSLTDRKTGAVSYPFWIEE
jgi:hypothetical protein